MIFRNGLHCAVVPHMLPAKTICRYREHSRQQKQVSIMHSGVLIRVYETGMGIGKRSVRNMINRGSWGLELVGLF
jgi:hypothetical protein